MILSDYGVSSVGSEAFFKARTGETDVRGADGDAGGGGRTFGEVAGGVGPADVDAESV